MSSKLRSCFGKNEPDSKPSPTPEQSQANNEDYDPLSIDRVLSDTMELYCHEIIMDSTHRAELTFVHLTVCLEFQLFEN